MLDRIRIMGCLRFLPAAVLVVAACPVWAEPARSTGNLEFERFQIPPTGRVTMPPPAPAPDPPADPPSTNDPPKHPPHKLHRHLRPFVPWRHTVSNNLGRLGVYYGDALYFHGPITGVYSPIDPNLVIYPPQDVTERPPAPQTPTDLARDGAPELALAALDLRLEDAPTDPELLLHRAIVLSIMGRFDHAAASASAALEADPDSILAPLDGSAYTGSWYEFRRVVVAAVRHAHRTGEARSWMLVSVLMHAEGRTEVADRMMARAASLASSPADTAAPKD